MGQGRMWSRRAAVRAFVWEEERRGHVEAPPSRRGQEPVKLREELSAGGRDLGAPGARTGPGSVAVEGGTALAQASVGTLRQVGASPPVRVSLRREVGDEALAMAAHEDPPDPGDLSGALAGLPEPQRVVVVLRHVLGLTPGEIAALLELPRGTVNSRLRRGLDALESWAREAR